MSLLRPPTISAYTIFPNIGSVCIIKHSACVQHGNKAVQHKVLPSSLLSHYHHLPKLHCQPSLNDILAFCLKCIYIHPITRRKYAFKTFHYRPSLCWGYCSFPSSMSCYGDICLLDSFDYLSRII